MSTSKTLKIAKGEDRTFNLTFKKNSVVFDITGYIIDFFIRANKTDTGDTYLKKKTVTDHSNGVHGVAVIKLTHDNTNIAIGDYWWQVRFTTPDGDIRIFNKERLQVE